MAPTPLTVHLHLLKHLKIDSSGNFGRSVHSLTLQKPHPIPGWTSTVLRPVFMSRRPLPWTASVSALSWHQTVYALNNVLSFLQKLRERGSAELEIRGLFSPTVQLQAVLIGTLLREAIGK